MTKTDYLHRLLSGGNLVNRGLGPLDYDWPLACNFWLLIFREGSIAGNWTPEKYVQRCHRARRLVGCDLISSCPFVRHLEVKVEHEHTE